MANDYNKHLEYLTTSRRKKVAGLSFPMSVSGVGGIFTSNEGIKSIRDGIIQLLLTARGERVMHPEFGTDVRRFVFEPNDPLLIDNLKQQISRSIEAYEPRVVVKRLKLTPYDDVVKITLTMALKDDFLGEETVEIII